MKKCERKSTEVLGDEREQVGITHHASHRADRQTHVVQSHEHVMS